MSPVELGSRNIMSLQNSKVPLCVECLSCKHRALLWPKDLKRGPNDHEMSDLVSLTRRMRCSQCRSGSVKALIAASELDAQAFMAKLA